MRKFDAIFDEEVAAHDAARELMERQGSISEKSVTEILAESYEKPKQRKEGRSMTEEEDRG